MIINFINKPTINNLYLMTKYKHGLYFSINVFYKIH